MPRRDDAADSTFLHKEPCPECGSRDNLARYSDGHAHCFTDGCGHWEPADGEGAERPITTDFTPKPKSSLVKGDITHITKRGLTEATCRLWDYQVGEFNGLGCHIANLRDANRRLIAQKIRLPDKDFRTVGPKDKPLPFFGMHLWANDRRSLIITEGELDALSVSQAQGHKYPVVSIPNGTPSAVPTVEAYYQWLDEFEKIVIMFDDDEPGRKAAAEVAELLPPGKAQIATIEGYKDANEALVDGQPGAIIKAFFGAKPYEPDGLYTLDDLEDDILKPVEWGRPWFLDTVTTWTFGRRDGEVYYFGAGTGVGKTDFFTQQIAYDALELNVRCGVIYLEQPPGETGKRICGKVGGKPFHIPSEAGGWVQEELDAAYAKLKATGNLILGGGFVAADWEVIKNRIRFMAKALKVKHFYLDHLTALADNDNERESLEKITKELALLAQECAIVIHVISHLATPEGKPHEEGGRVMLRHFKGSRAIGFWAHYAFGMERNTQADDPDEKARTTFRCLKDRYTGRATGNTLTLGYDHDTCRLTESAFALDV